MLQTQQNTVILITLLTAVISLAQKSFVPTHFLYVVIYICICYRSNITLSTYYLCNFFLISYKKQGKKYSYYKK